MKRRFFLVLGLFLFVCVILGALAYARYIDWPASDDSHKVRVYLPEEYPISGAHHYLLRNFMDSWDLYRFSTTPEGVAFLAVELHLESQGMVENFDLIISKPPPYWWDPERLREAEYFTSYQRAPDGRLYDLLYSVDEGIVYMIRFDG